MKIFLSHASEVAAIADAIELTLNAEGHDVFLDRSDLPSGEAYDERIRKAVAASDLFIFLVTPEAVAPGRYTLTELACARETWRHPAGRVLPVIVRPTDIALIPPYLKAVTFLEPEGNISAAVAAAVARMRRPWRRSVPVWAALALAVVIAVGTAVWWVAERRARAADVAALLESARLAQGSDNYAAAWAVYAGAPPTVADHPEVSAAWQRLAMAWLDNIRVRAGADSFAAIADQTHPVLARCAQSPDKARAADCLAHMGWADFLRGRDGARPSDPVARYREALALDSGNVYAHAMWGFDINRTHGPVALAREHTASALASGRVRAWVRHLQIAGLLWRRDDDGDRELVRVANDMRIGDAALQRDPVITPDRWRLWDTYIARLLRTTDDTFTGVLPPADHLATFQWLFPLEEVPDDKRRHHAFLLAGFQERAGARDAALRIYRELRDTFARDGSLVHGGPLPDRTVEAVARLSKR